MPQDNTPTAGAAPSAAATTTAQPPSATAKVSVDEFAETTFKAVMRAAQAHNSPIGHIIYGIIYSPQMLNEKVNQA